MIRGLNSCFRSWGWISDQSTTVHPGTFERFYCGSRGSPRSDWEQGPPYWCSRGRRRLYREIPIVEFAQSRLDRWRESGHREALGRRQCRSIASSCFGAASTQRRSDCIFRSSGLACGKECNVAHPHHVNLWRSDPPRAGYRAFPTHWKHHWREHDGATACGKTGDQSKGGASAPTYHSGVAAGARERSDSLIARWGPMPFAGKQS